MTFLIPLLKAMMEILVSNLISYAEKPRTMEDVGTPQNVRDQWQANLQRKLQTKTTDSATTVKTL